MAIKARYTGDGSAYINGIPARDLDDAEYAALTAEQKHDVRACGLYDVTQATDKTAAKKEGDR